MRFTSRTWFLLSLLFFVAALFFWLLGDGYQAKKKHSPNAPKPQVEASTSTPSSRPYPLLTRLPADLLGQLPASVGNTGGVTAVPSTRVAKPSFPHRIGNTSKTLNELARLDSAILLRNALIDTARPLQLAIPEHLRSKSETGSYVVQSRGPISDGFRARLREVDATIVSYIPNNAFLIRVTSDKARRLAAWPETQAVLPFEPYYKLDDELLALAVQLQPLPAEKWLRLTLFPGERDAALEALKPLGSEVISEEPSPFGPQLLIRPGSSSLAALAQLPAVQGIEPYYQRGLLSDRTRVALGVSVDGVTNANYLGLTGSNILVNLNDSGIDPTHPDLLGRVAVVGAADLTDPDGHGTHMAGVIAGSGAQSGTVRITPDGSETNANFRGLAPRARLLFLPLDFAPDVNEVVSDTYLQRTAARTNFVRRKTGPIISNNSWWNVGANQYDSSSARFDAAVRDALPDQTNSQPILYVFAAGNSGEGSDNGLNGNPNSIPSPANAKNVITVGASEHFRRITNSFVITNADLTTITNIPFLSLSDDEDEVASFSGRGNVGIGTEGPFGRFKPDVIAPGTFVISTRSRGWTLGREFDPNSILSGILGDLNVPLGPNYRYDSGSSLAAASISGTLALMQEFFEFRLPVNLRRTNSPALMKALLINGARSLGSRYDLQVQSSINLQGWGLANLTNSIPALLTTQPETSWPIRFFDQSPTNAVATGQRRSWDVTLSTNSQQLPFRATLVWTDPPGNPIAGIKLVNDLDLVVSNTATHKVYYGNNIPISSDFNEGSGTNSAPVTDVINNVENVFISEPFGSNFVVSVVGRRVNVNAVTDYAQATGLGNDVVQDYALVLSIGDLTLTNELRVIPVLTNSFATSILVTTMTNGVPLLNQRVGAQPTALNLRHGLASQWNFYVFTNIFITNDFSSVTNGTNVAFVTFLPPNLSQARNLQADIDLYVSKDSRLLNLDPSVVDAATKSVTRGGTEYVALTNAAIGDIFYIGVKSEDQQAAEYGLIGISSDEPFDQNDNGNRVLRGFPFRAIIPDGTAENPGSVQVLAIGLVPNLIQRVIATSVISHGNLGDLIGILSHERNSAVLNNHTLLGNLTGTNIFIYDDSSFGSVPFSQRTDGPGTLNDFTGSSGTGVWLFNMVDNSLAGTGRVESLIIRVQPIIGGDLLLAGAAGLDGSVEPNGITTYFADVPSEATNLTVEVSRMTGPLDVLIQRETLPTASVFDKKVSLTPPGGTVTFGIGDEPNPLRTGRYFISLFNSNSVSTVDFHISIRLDLSLALDSGRTLSMTNGLALPGEATISSSITVPVDKEITDVQVGVRINHPRASDLVLHLVSPQGTRVLLGENRGGINASGFGAGYGTNIAYTVFTEDTNRVVGLTPIKFATPPYINTLGGSGAAPLFFDGFENSPPAEYGSNTVVSGWQVTRGKIQLHGPVNPLGVVAGSGSNFLELDTTRSPAAVLTSFSTTPGTDYQLSFSYYRNPVAPLGRAHALQLYYGPPQDSRPATKFIAVQNFGWASTDIVFRATSPLTALELSALTSAGPLVDTVHVNEILPTTNSYVLPEEALDLLRGERSIGEWKLEVSDDRQGPLSGLSPALLGWQLQLKYADPRPKAVLLRDKVIYSGTVTNNQTNYFIVDVCDTARLAVSTLTGPLNRLNFLADRSGLPSGRLVTDDFIPQINAQPVDSPTNSGVASLTLDATRIHPAPLEPGKRHYLAVHNLGLGETNSYTIQVSLDNDECHVLRPVIRLTNAVPYTNTIAVSSILLDNYVFNVSTNAVAVDFELFPENGDLVLVLRHDPPSPDLAIFDYISDNLGGTNEYIFVKTNSTPVRLLPGDWFLGVFNKTPNPVPYRIRATELVTAGLNIIPLTNDVPVDFEIKTGSALTNFFFFSVTNQSPLLTFDLYNLNGSAELLTGFNRLPPADGSTTNPASATQPLQIDIRPATIGDYYLAVRSSVGNTNDLRFTIRARLSSDADSSTNFVFIDPKVSIGLTNICFGWNSLAGREYQLQAKTNIEERTWTAISPRLISTSATNSFCIDFPTKLRFFRIVLFPAPPPTPPTPSQFIDPRLNIGRTNLCLSWPSLVGTNYFVEAKTNIQDSTWSRLSTQITATSTNTQYCIDLPTPYRFFRIAVVGGTTPPPPPTPSQFIDPRLNISRTNLCLLWPSLVGTNYFVEAKTNIQDSAWSRLSTQITATSTNTQYCIDLPTPYRFFRIAVAGGTTPPPPPPTPSQFIDPRLNISRTNLCLLWPSSVGTNYFVEAKTNIQDSTWSRLSTQITATSTNTQYCIDLPTPYRFFRIAVVGGTTPPPPPPTPSQFIDPRLNISRTNLCLLWPSLVGTNYFVEAKTNIQDSTWSRLSTQITATSTNTQYCIDLPTPYRFFRIAVVGGTTPPPPPPTPSQFIDPRLNISRTNLCLLWPSLVGTNYFVEAKTNIQDSTWSRLSTQITATSTNTQHCIDLPTPYRFFRISAVGGSTNALTLKASVTSAGGRLQFQWDASVGQSYELQQASNLALAPLANWITVTNITATSNSVTVTDPTPATNSMRFYRLIRR